MFAAGAQILVPPTTDRDRLNRAIDGFSTSLGTAIGNGVLASIDALSRVNPDIAPSTVTLSPAERRQDRFASQYVPDVIVLLTDGAATTGVDPRDAAPAGGRPARARVHDRIRHRPPRARWCAPPSSSAVTRSSRSVVAAASRSTWASGGGGNFLQIDEATLRAIARTTGGTYAAPRARRSSTRRSASCPGASSR